jgi:hypothetical protein
MPQMDLDGDGGYQHEDDENQDIDHEGKKTDQEVFDQGLEPTLPVKSPHGQVQVQQDIDINGSVDEIENRIDSSGADPVIQLFQENIDQKQKKSGTIQMNSEYRMVYIKKLAPPDINELKDQGKKGKRKEKDLRKRVDKIFSEVLDPCILVFTDGSDVADDFPVPQSIDKPVSLPVRQPQLRRIVRSHR